MTIFNVAHIFSSCQQACSPRAKKTTRNLKKNFVPLSGNKTYKRRNISKTKAYIENTLLLVYSSFYKTLLDIYFKTQYKAISSEKPVKNITSPHYNHTDHNMAEVTIVTSAIKTCNK